MLEKIRIEIETDPTGRGYKGKTPMVREEHTSRIYNILIEVSFAPNIVELVDIKNVLKEVI